jgi:hypothetical protein
MVSKSWQHGSTIHGVVEKREVSTVAMLLLPMAKKVLVADSRRVVIT